MEDALNSVEPTAVDTTDVEPIDTPPEILDGITAGMVFPTEAPQNLPQTHPPSPPQPTGSVGLSSLLSTIEGIPTTQKRSMLAFVDPCTLVSILEENGFTVESSLRTLAYYAGPNCVKEGIKPKQRIEAIKYLHGMIESSLKLSGLVATVSRVQDDGAGRRDSISVNHVADVLRDTRELPYWNQERTKDNGKEESTQEEAILASEQPEPKPEPKPEPESEPEPESTESTEYIDTTSGGDSNHLAIGEHKPPDSKRSGVYKGLAFAAHLFKDARQATIEQRAPEIKK